MRHKIHEVEDQGEQRGLTQRRPDPGPDQLRVAVAEDLLVVDGHPLAGQAPQLLRQQLRLVGVQAAFIVGVTPPLWVMALDLVRVVAAEDRVPGVGRGRGQDRVVQGLVDVEVGRQGRCQDPPLVESHAVENDQEHRALAQKRQDRLLNHVHGQHGSFLHAPHPARVVLRDPLPEVPSQIREHGGHGVQQTRLPGRLEADVPIHHLGIDAGEGLGRVGLFPQHGQTAEA